MPRPFRVLGAGLALVLATLAAATPAPAAPAIATPAAVAAAPALPDSMAAIGDSITQAVDVCCFYGSWPSHSWSTGGAVLDGIASHYERIRARNPAILGHRWNNAVSGARMADAPGQARRTVGQGAEDVTILMGANDLCGWDGTLTPTATFRASSPRPSTSCGPASPAATCSWPRSRTCTSSGASCAPTPWPRPSGRRPVSAPSMLNFLQLARRPPGRHRPRARAQRRPPRRLRHLVQLPLRRRPGLRVRLHPRPGLPPRLLPPQPGRPGHPGRPHLGGVLVGLSGAA